jgi:hypothetical protein
MPKDKKKAYDVKPMSTFPSHGTKAVAKAGTKGVARSQSLIRAGKKNASASLVGLGIGATVSNARKRKLGAEQIKQGVSSMPSPKRPGPKAAAIKKANNQKRKASVAKKTRTARAKATKYTKGRR